MKKINVQTQEFSMEADFSWPEEAEFKASEEEIDTSKSVNNYGHRHTVAERRKANAKAKKYHMPRCGIRHSRIRELQSTNPNDLKGVDIFSQFEMNQFMRYSRIYNHLSREEAMHENHPKAKIQEILLEMNEPEEIVNEHEVKIEFPELYSTFASFKIFEKIIKKMHFGMWSILDMFFKDGDMFFTTDGEVIFYSDKAIKYAKEHYKELMKLFKNNFIINE